MKGDIKVVKRDGRKEDLDYDKINKVLIWATEGIKDVSASDVAMNAKLQIHDEITTEQIHRVMIKSADELTNENNPNYQFVAGNLCNYLLRKKLHGSVSNLPHLFDLIKRNIKRGVYDSIILEKYTEEEIGKINNFIKHDRDLDFPYCGIQQLIDKYLAQDRKNGEVYETPQYMYIMISMTLFADYDKTKRMSRIKSFYDDISKFKINLPTPIMAGVRAPGRQWSSCTLIDIGDSLNSIFNSNTAIGYYTSKRAGIGLNAGRIRSLGDKIRNGEVIHTGVIPYLKMFEATVKSCTQNGVRGGSATVHFPFWHKEIQDILVLKNNKGTDDNRVRKLDYSIQFCRLFYKRFVENKDITLFSPADVPDLLDAFGLDNDKFDLLYEKYEADKSIDKKKVNARDLFNQFCQERIGTGRMYVMNIDNANSHSSFKDKITMSNLCLDGNSKVSVKIFDYQFDLLPEKVEWTWQDDGSILLDMNLVQLNDLFSKTFINSNEVEDKIFMYAKSLIKVKSYDFVNKKEEYMTVLSSALMNENSKVLKITDESSGKSIVCTPDHQIWTENRGYVLANDLKNNDVLLIL